MENVLNLHVEEVQIDQDVDTIPPGLLTPQFSARFSKIRWIANHPPKNELFLLAVTALFLPYF